DRRAGVHACTAQPDLPGTLRRRARPSRAVGHRWRVRHGVRVAGAHDPTRPAGPVHYPHGAGGVIVALVCGATAGAGLWLAARGWMPPRPSLADALAQLRANP